LLFLEDGNIELTNNCCQRELRASVLEKNWPSVGHDESGARTAAILTIIATCISHSPNSRAYLHLVTKLSLEGWPKRKVRELLPDRIPSRIPKS